VTVKIKILRTSFTCVAIILILSPSALKPQIAAGASVEPTNISIVSGHKMSLAQCLDSALANSRFRPAAQQGVVIAEAQLKQARSGYWPQVSAQLSAVRLDDDPNFVMPPGLMTLQVPILGTMNVDVPAQDVKLLDKFNGLARLEFSYPVYTGGLISSLVRLAESGLEIAHIDSRRTDAQIQYDVKRYYYGSVLARNLLRIGLDAVVKLEATLQLTENLYQKGSGKVKRTDYLKNKIIVESIKSVVHSVEQNEKTARAALGNAMGILGSSDIEPADESIPFDPTAVETSASIRRVQLSNPDLAKVNVGLSALEAKRDQANSGFYPRVAVIGNLSHTENAWDYGYVSPRMKDQWMIGIGVAMDLFSGFRTRGEVEEATARIQKLQYERVLLTEGLALQTLQIENQLEAARQTELASRIAMETAAENLDLTDRAYQSDLVEVKDLIEAQILASFAQAQYEKARYDHYEAQARLDLLIGSETDPGRSAR
jgi:outer membrane protein